MQNTVIKTLCDAVNQDRMMGHLREFARWIKLSGTPDELTSFRYLEKVLKDYGYATKLISHDAYISLPGNARVELGGDSPVCITHSFSRPSPPGGLRAPLVYAGFGTDAELAKANVQGKAVLLEGIANPAASLRASLAGAVAQVHVSPHEHRHEMCISPVWGSPDSDAVALLPKTVVVSIAKADGDRAKARLERGEAVEAVIHAEVDTRWRKTPLLVAELMPDNAAADTPFVMFSGHHDTWHYGVMDNGSANATMLEVARLLGERRREWKRGLRLCFWSGHSHGRYSGSAWYADNHFAELEARCVVHVNVDSTGGVGASVLTDAIASAELQRLAGEAVLAESGQTIEGHRMARAGDQSFWGVGIPSMYMGMSEQAAGVDVAASIISGGRSKTGKGLGWWWHTPEDTIDKIDPANQVRDTRIYVHTIWRLLSDADLPMDYTAYAGKLREAVAGLQDKLGTSFDLAPLAQRAALLEEKAGALPRTHADADTRNRIRKALSRALVPLDYTRGDRFAHDPALPFTPYPVLDPIRRLAAEKPDTDAFRFARVAAQRAVNRTSHALDAALAALTQKK